jgi:hypothetical protein
MDQNARHTQDVLIAIITLKSCATLKVCILLLVIQCIYVENKMLT